VRAQLVQHHESGPEWWDSPTADLGIEVWPAGLLIKPASSALPERVWYTASFVNTGVQLRTVRHPKQPSNYPGDHHEFLPWTSVHDVTVEGADQIERRPSVAAVLVFGVLGLGASKAIKRSYLVISSDHGDYVLERQDLLPLELSGYVAPVLREMHHVAQQDDPITRLLEAQQETNRLLALIVERLPERGR
jgi:hypothetical protein